MSTQSTDYPIRLTPENIQPGLRIRGRRPDDQDRFITGVYKGRQFAVTGVASGRSTFIDWQGIGRYDIVNPNGTG